MATDEEFRQAALQSPLIGDLYSLKQHLFESDIPIKVFYLEREEGSFTRPAFFLRITSMPIDPYNGYMSWQVEQVQVQFFSETILEAHSIANQVMQILAPRPDLILPKYDFTQNPPKKIPINNRMGIRVDPTTVTADPFQEPTGWWNVPITFTMRAPILSPNLINPLEHVYEKLVWSPPYEPPVVTITALATNFDMQITSS